MDALKMLKGLMGEKSMLSGLGGNLLGGLLGGGNKQQAAGGGGGGILGGGGGMLGGLLGGIMGGGKQEAAAAAPAAPTADENQQAVLIIRAMVNAAKSDGRIDDTEQQNIISRMGDLSQDEVAFLKEEFAAPLDASAFANSIPNGMQQHIYQISLAAIELDSKNEARYLHELAQGLDLKPEVCNEIHQQMGAPQIYS